MLREFKQVRPLFGSNITEDKISGISVITKGEALGHGVYIDETFLNDLVNFAEGKQFKSRFGHPSMCEDSIGTELGYLENFSKDGDQVIADLVFLKTEYNAAMIDHVKTYAEKRPQDLGLSIVFEDGGLSKPTKESKGLDIIKLKELHEVDFVDSPAANPAGLFTRKKSLFEQVNSFKMGILEGVEKLFSASKKVEETPVETKVETESPANQTNEIESLKIQLSESLKLIAGAIDEQKKENEELRKNIEKKNIPAKFEQAQKEFTKTELANTVGASTALSSEDFAKGFFAFNDKEYQFSKKGKVFGKKSFATGADLSNVIERCVPFLPQVFYDILPNTDIFQYMQNITVNIPSGTTNLFDVEIPRMDFAGVGLYGEDLIREADGGCEAFSPVGTATPNQHRMRVRNGIFDYEICPKEWRDVNNGAYYVDDETMPAEMVLMSLIMNRMLINLYKKVWSGVYAGGYEFIDGIFTQVQDAYANPTNYAGQQPTRLDQSAYTNTNAVSQLEEFVNIDNIPTVMQYRTDLIMFTPYKLQQLYGQDYRSQYTAAPYNNSFWKEQMDGDPYRPDWQTITQLTGTNTVVVTPYFNMVYALQNPDFANAPEIYITPFEKKYQIRWEFYFGCSAKSFAHFMYNNIV